MEKIEKNRKIFHLKNLEKKKKKIRKKKIFFVSKSFLNHFKTDLSTKKIFPIFFDLLRRITFLYLFDWFYQVVFTSFLTKYRNVGNVQPYNTQQMSSDISIYPPSRVVLNVNKTILKWGGLTPSNFRERELVARGPYGPIQDRTVL